MINVVNTKPFANIIGGTLSSLIYNEQPSIKFGCLAKDLVAVVVVRGEQRIGLERSFTLTRSDGVDLVLDASNSMDLDLSSTNFDYQW